MPTAADSMTHVESRSALPLLADSYDRLASKIEVEAQRAP